MLIKRLLSIAFIFFGTALLLWSLPLVFHWVSPNSLIGFPSDVPLEDDEWYVFNKAAGIGMMFASILQIVFQINIWKKARNLSGIKVLGWSMGGVIISLLLSWAISELTFIIIS